MATLEEKTRAFEQTRREMAPYTARFLAAIYGCHNAEEGELLGSGTFLEVNGGTYLLTAAHVAEEGQRYWRMAYSMGYGQPPQVINNPFFCLSFPFDLAIVRLNQSRPQKLSPEDVESSPVGIGSIQLDHLARDVGKIDSDAIFIHGFPGKRSMFVRFFNGVVSDSFPYGTFTGASSYSWFDPNIHIAIQYPTSGQIDDLGRPADLPDPHGLSGSAVWRTNLNHHGPTGWSSNVARVVGVITNWDLPAQSLVATRIEVVRSFVGYSLRREFAYFRWLHRGQPVGDDWDDWFSAERWLPGL